MEQEPYEPPTQQQMREVLDGIIDFDRVFRMEVALAGSMDADAERSGYILARVISQQNNLAVAIHLLMDRLDRAGL